MPQDLSLVPNSGIQFVTYQFNENEVQLDRSFIERRFEKKLADGTQRTAWKLEQGWTDNKNDPSPAELRDGDRRYKIDLEKAIEPFVDRWVPVPYLRAKDSSMGTMLRGFDDGPTNWVRVRVTRNENRPTEAEPSHIVVFAFDTKIDDYSPVARPSRQEQEASDADLPYNPDTEPTAADIEKRKQFSFVTGMASLDRFLVDEQPDRTTGGVKDYQAWVVEWLHDYFEKFLQTNERTTPNKLEHVARWIGLLHLLQVAVTPPSVRFFDTISDRQAYAPVEVDLILDIGNSRTCGMLIEDFPDEDLPGLSNTITLSLRDLDRIDQTYVEPFDSHIEFSQASFGDDAKSNASGREGAFLWPSIVRVGREATRLRNAQDDGNEALCGMSSPKRYLWDVSEASQPWQFPKHNYVGQWQPTTFASMRTFLNARGDSRSHVRKDANGDENLFDKLYDEDFPQQDRTKPSPYFKYSRSSMYTLMLAELIWQAFVQINNPIERRKRKQSETPRHLRRIVLTLPTAMPAREQMIMQMRAQSAVTLIWELMKWNINPPPGTDRPQIEVLWDEASCVQMVWLYGELKEKFTNMQGVFELLGQPRLPFTADAPPAADAVARESLRVASIDIGGGTTDLMITTYFQQDRRAITPVQTFRESVRIAGDDILQAVIERVVIPSLEGHLLQMGLSMPINLLRELFRGDRADQPIQQINRRRHFVHRVLQPAALAVMSAYEGMSQHDYRTTESRLLRDTIPDFDAIPAATLDYLSGPARQMTGVDLDWNQVPLVFDFGRAREAVQETLAAVLDNMSEAINHFDCDIVLISGRPSRLPAIAEMMVDTLAVSPDRLVAMHQYQPGSWYPFLERNSMRIADPKTAAVVGGTICALADRRIRNFMVHTDKIQMRSTAKYIGVLEDNGQLLDHNVLFGDEDDTRRKASKAVRSFDYYSPMSIGFRQLPYQRWTATPLYELRETRGGRSIPKPVSVMLERDGLAAMERGEYDPNEVMQSVRRREASREGIVIYPTGGTAESLRLTFRTMDSNASYWLDTGTLLSKGG